MSRKDKYMNSPVRTDQSKVPQSPPQSFPITSEMAHALINNQAAELNNEAARLDLQRKQIDYNADFAKESLRLQANDLASRPKENRRTVLHFALIIGAFVFILLGFVIYLLENGHKDLVTSILKGVGWVVSNIVAYYLGQSKSEKAKSSNGDGSEAEVVN